MHALNSFDRFTGRWMPLIIVLCLTAGIAFAAPLGRLAFLVPYFFAFMTFSGALRASFRSVYDAIRHPLPLLAALVIIHIVLPLAALGAGRLFFAGSPDFVAGLVLEYTVPSAVASVMWCVMSGGSVALTLCIIVIDTLGAPLLLPFTLHVLLGADLQIDVTGMMRDLLWMVALPALLTLLLNQFTHGAAGRRLAPVFSPFGKIALIVIVTINSTRIAPFVLHMNAKQFALAGTVLLISVTGYLLGLLLARLMRLGKPNTVSIMFACGMRNISAGAVLAAAYFPAGAMFPVMVGTLFQQAVASLFSRLLTRGGLVRAKPPAA